MELLNQSHYQDVRHIVNRKKWPDYNYTATLHPNRAGEEKMERVESIDWSCDYANAFTAHVDAVVMCDQNVYKNKIWPYRNNMEITLHLFATIPCTLKLIKMERRYRAILSEVNDADMNPEALHSLDNDTMSLTEYKTFHVQLVELFVETTPYVTTEGLYINENREQVMRGAISHALESVSNREKYDYLWIDPKWDVRRPIERALLRTKTNMIDIPHLIQKDFGGFYNNGMGSFHHHWGGTHYRHNPIKKYNQWMVYPLMDVTRWHRVTNNNKLNLWVVPDTTESWNGYDHTYEWYPPKQPDDACGAHKDLVMSIYVKRVKGNAEAAENRPVVKPYGITTTSPNEFMDIPVDVTKAGVFGSGDRLSKSVQFHKRNDGLDSFVNHYKANTVNYAVNSSLMKQNLGKRMDFVWDHSYHEILMPGMPVRMHWEEDRKTKVVYGILLHSHSLILNMGKVDNESSRFDTKTYLSIYVERPDREL